MKPSDYGENWNKWDALFDDAEQNRGVPFELMKAICMVESSLGCDPRVAHGLEHPEDVEGSKSEDGKSWGILQLTLLAARDFDLIASPAKLNVPAYSVLIASRLLCRLMKQFPGEEELVVRAYNAGPGAVRHNPEVAQGYWEKYVERKAII